MGLSWGLNILVLNLKTWQPLRCARPALITDVTKTNSKSYKSLYRLELYIGTYVYQDTDVSSPVLMKHIKTRVWEIGGKRYKIKGTISPYYFSNLYQLYEA